MKNLSFIFFALLFFSQKTSAQSGTCGYTNCPPYLSEYVASYFFSPMKQAANADKGAYLPRLLANNLYDFDRFKENVHIADDSSSTDVMALPSSGCAPLTVHFTVSDTSDVDEWHWLLPGATPAESFEMEPIVTYDTSGIYAVTLIITNVLGSDTLHYPAFIEVQPGLVNPGFTVQVQGDSIITTNTTQGFTEYYWLLNGVAVDADSMQNHIFVVDSSGSYVVSLYVANACDTALIEQSVIVTISSPDFCGCVNCPNPIPDNFMGNFFYYVSNATNNDLASATQGVCGVRVHFDHEYLGDLTMRLFSPAGQFVTLVGPTGFFGPTDGSNWDVTFNPCADAVFPDPGFNEIWSNLGAWTLGEFYSGSYYPADGCLEDFDTGPVKGIWRLEIVDGQAVDMGNLYDFEILFCDTIGIACLPCVGPPTANFSVFTSGWDVLLDNISTDAYSYQLSFGDGEIFSSNFVPSMHTYADTGTYLLHIIASNLCGTDTFDQILNIRGALPTASAIVSPQNGCVPLKAHVDVLEANNVNTWHWFFPGGNPAESFQMEPVVIYLETGTYPAILIISNSVGADTILYPSFVEVGPALLNPGFTVQVHGDTIFATNTTENYTNYIWLVDGVSMNAGEPLVVTVGDSGTYVITLIVVNNCEKQVVEQSITVTSSSVKENNNNFLGLSLLPNPNDGQCRLEVSALENLPADIVILNAAGQKVFTQKTDIIAGKNTRDLDLTHLPSGFYLLRVQTATGSKTIPFTLQH